MEQDLNAHNVTKHDWFLELFVNMVNKNELEIAITLTTHGYLISGFLIGGGEYFKGVAEEFSSATGDAESIKQLIIQMGDNVYNKTDETENITKTEFLHLKNARYFHPNGLPITTNKGVWWRGRLSEISGFTLGNLSTE